ncbi:AAA family ATPase [Nodularia spumigena CS-584]|jgi:predicted ATP-binding protein involved in virulence|uniref:ATP-binding protein n=3 Tax=Nodularia spumigena TaxID=70799 RepID=A0A166J3P5_NODSP|nr:MULTISPECIES: AAA family ATPase [Cyanophyceae]MDB9357626.1 AAA family ATPase [Nodularia spumigena CS-587/03]AHJ29884.1 ATP binding protein [Nodularia spumigena CCY9414]EAW45542.1 ATP binding protein [Nodularia spumigena CCY9414]KZL49189.1 ATP-binding protein [Nodularia spumigena CENA596]MDB9341456.1 AAA family ATPase [Nodularia spumigena CS-589/07]
MKVKRLKMQSFRGIGDLTLDFNQNEPTILIGINGVGKSSIIECLAILLSRFTSSIQHSTPSGRLFTEEDITNGEKETHNEVNISFDSEEITWSLTKVKKGRNKDTSSNLSAMTKVAENIKENLHISHIFNIPIVVYYSTNRAVLDIPLKIRTKHSFEQIDAYENALTGNAITGLGSEFRIFFEWFRRQEDLENELRLENNAAYRDKQLEAVRQAISSLIPDFSNLRVRRSPLRMTLQKQGEELIVNQLSDGEKCLLAMVGDLARRLAIANPGLPDPLQGSGIILIDEIELHLHPKWQRGIIPDLTRTFPNCQFIVTTHSPQVISDVKPEGIYLLEKTDQGVIAKQPESSFGRDSNRILEDLMDVPERPQEIKDSLLELFRMIDAGNLESARNLRQQLANEIGIDEPEFVKADVLIRRKEILNR